MPSQTHRIHHTAPLGRLLPLLGYELRLRHARHALDRAAALQLLPDGGQQLAEALEVLQLGADVVLKQALDAAAVGTRGRREGAGAEALVRLKHGSANGTGKVKAEGGRDQHDWLET